MRALPREALTPVVEPLRYQQWHWRGVKESAEVVVLEADMRKGRTELVKSKDLDEELVEVGVGASGRRPTRHYQPRSIWRKPNGI
jgi:hypothetical protein